MKTLRSEVEIAKIGVKVKKIWRDGKDVVLTVDGGERKARLLQAEIAKRVNLEALPCTQGTRGHFLGEYGRGDHRGRGTGGHREGDEVGGGQSTGPGGAGGSRK